MYAQTVGKAKALKTKKANIDWLNTLDQPSKTIDSTETYSMSEVTCGDLLRCMVFDGQIPKWQEVKLKVAELKMFSFLFLSDKDSQDKSM